MRENGTGLKKVSEGTDMDSENPSGLALPAIIAFKLLQSQHEGGSVFESSCLAVPRGYEPQHFLISAIDFTGELASSSSLNSDASIQIAYMLQAKAGNLQNRHILWDFAQWPHALLEVWTLQVEALPRTRIS